MPLGTNNSISPRYHEVHAVRSRRCSSPADGVTGGESLNKYIEEKMSGRGTVDGGPGKGDARITAQPLSASDRLLSSLTTKSFGCRRSNAGVVRRPPCCLCTAGCQSAPSSLCCCLCAA